MARPMTSRVPAPPGAAQTELDPVPQPGARSEVLRRFQIGAVGIIGVLLLIGLASIIENRAKESDSTAVAEAVPAAAASSSPSAPDPLAQAGVVPDMPAEPTAGPQPGPTTSPSATNAR